MSEKDFLSQFSSDGKKPDSYKEEVRVKVEKPKKQIDPKVFIIAGVVVVVLGVLSYFLFFAPKIEMPNFVGQTKSDVAAWVKQQGITTSGIVFKDEYNFDNDEDVILDQSIEAGKKVKNDVKITFTISKGADPDEKVSVPDIKNMTKSEIESWIKENKLTKAKITTTYNETVEKDKVISYEVKGVDEADFTRSSTMNISVSKGPQPAGTVTVTDFKKQRYEAVEEWAKKNKVELVKVEVFSDSIDADYVISQSIDANKTMKQNETLTVTVSKGKGVKVPDIYKMTEDEISKWGTDNLLTSLNISSKYSESGDKVLSSNVKPGQTISTKDEVNIVLNKGKYFYASAEKLPDIIGMNTNQLEDWCNEKRKLGIDAYCGNWSGSAEVYVDGNEKTNLGKGKIVSYEISSYSTGQKFNINDRLPLDVRFSIVVCKGLYYNLGFNTTGGEKVTVNDLINFLSSKNISFTLASDITTMDYGKGARIVGVNANDKVYDDVTYVIEKVNDNSFWYKTVQNSNSGSSTGSSTTTGA